MRRVLNQRPTCSFLQKTTNQRRNMNTKIAVITGNNLINNIDDTIMVMIDKPILFDNGMTFINATAL